MRLAWIPMFVAMGVAGGWMHAAAAPDETERKAEVGRSAPDFKLKDIYGKEFSLSEFKGKVVVLEWVNPGCPFVVQRHDAQLMQKLYARYAEKDVIWLGIDSSHDAKPESLRVYSAQKLLNYPVLMDPDGNVGRLYDAKTTPHMYVIDKEGTLVYTGAIDDDPRGVKSEDERTDYVAAALDAVLADRDVATPRTEPYGCTVKYAP